MSAVETLLLAFDHAWAHKWESVQRVLDGVTDAEAAWQAPCYAEDEHEAGWPAPGSIAWHVAHLAHCKRYYTQLIDARKQASAPDATPRTALSTFAAERQALEAAHTAQRAAIQGLHDDELAHPACGSEMLLGEFIAMTTRHDSWHAAQIAVARRLFRTRVG